ncbi:MAG: hypothetical protein JSW52_11210 [Candidatus Coatesbacteria bacterium]|nr:MAG: hypothetical protein JSW52_11210 [Candidatus Coatesbacteria bacterium]
MRNYTATFVFSLVVLSPFSLTGALDADAREPVVYRDGTIVFYAKDADEFGGELVTDPYAESDLVLKISPSTKLYGEIVLRGPGYTFCDGVYLINFFIRTEGGLGSDRAIAEVEVARRNPPADSDYSVSDMRTITGLLFTSEETYTAVPLCVSLGEPEELEFRVRYLGNAVLYVDRVTVKAAAP